MGARTLKFDRVSHSLSLKRGPNMCDPRQRGPARNYRSKFITVGSLIIGLCLASFGARAQPMMCPAGQIACPGGNCVDPSTDTRNCGSCGNSCATGQACTAGVCTSVAPPSDGLFACQFTVGNLAGNTIVPTGITLSGPAGQP